MLWGGYFLLTPVYVFESGQPQLADYLMVAIIGFLLVSGRCKLPPHTRTVTYGVIAVALYMVAVNVVWTATLRDLQLLNFVFYYGFNLVGTVSFLWTFQWIGRRFAAVTAAAILISTIGQFALSQVHLGNHISRARCTIDESHLAKDRARTERADARRRCVFCR